MPYTGDPTEDSRQNSSIHLKCHCLFEKRYLSTLVRFKILFVLYVLCTVAFCLSVILQHLYFVFYMNIENLSYSKSFRKWNLNGEILIYLFAFNVCAVLLTPVTRVLFAIVSTVVIFFGHPKYCSRKITHFFHKIGYILVCRFFSMKPQSNGFSLYFFYEKQPDLVTAETEEHLWLNKILAVMLLVIHKFIKLWSCHIDYDIGWNIT